MTYVAMILLVVIAYAILVHRRNRVLSEIKISSSESQFHYCGCYCHPSHVSSWVECKVGDSNILLRFESYARYSLGRTRVTPTQWDEKIWLKINGTWQETAAAKAFVQRYWRALKVEPLALATTGYARLRAIARGEIETAVRQKREARKRAARELVEARKKISEL